MTLPTGPLTALRAAGLAIKAAAKVAQSAEDSPFAKLLRQDDADDTNDVRSAAEISVVDESSSDMLATLQERLGRLIHELGFASAATLDIRLDKSGQVRIADTTLGAASIEHAITRDDQLHRELSQWLSRQESQRAVIELPT